MYSLLMFFFFTLSVVEVDLHETVEGGGGGASIEHYLPRHLCAAKVQCLRGEGKGKAERQEIKRGRRKGRE